MPFGTPVPQRWRKAPVLSRAARAYDALVSMKFSVCIPATRAAFLPTVIASIRDQSWPAWELIVVGQGDHSALAAAVEASAGGDPRIRYIHEPGRGISRSRNAAIAAAGGDVLAFTDDDCECRQDWLETLAAAFSADRELGLVGGAVVAPRPRQRLGTCPALLPAEALYEPARNGRQAPAGWDWIGANFALRTETARSIGRFDECLGAGSAFPCGDDTDYKLRLEAAGVRMLSTPRAVVLHTHGARYGLRSILLSQAAYATGNGATAAKLTLSGDIRGEQWREETRERFATGWLRRRRPHRLVIDARAWWFFARAYRTCLREFALDGNGLLRPGRGQQVGASAQLTGT